MEQSDRVTENGSAPPSTFAFRTWFSPEFASEMPAGSCRATAATHPRSGESSAAITATNGGTRSAAAEHSTHPKA